MSAHFTPSGGDRVLWEGETWDVVGTFGDSVVLGDRSRRWLVATSDVAPAAPPPWAVPDRRGDWNARYASVQTALKAVLDSEDRARITVTDLIHRAQRGFERLYTDEGHRTPGQAVFRKQLSLLRSNWRLPSSAARAARAPIVCPRCNAELFA